MLALALVGLVAGVLTGVSPCVLPMLPIIFFAGTSGDQASASSVGTDGASGATAVATSPSLRQRVGRPVVIILGLITSFSIIILFGTAAISALGLPDDLLLWIGLVLLVVVGLGFIFPALGHWIEKPFYRLPKVSNSDATPFLFGMGLGTLYVPCAGPVLAAFVVAGATGNVGWSTVVGTVSFAVGAALPLLVFAILGTTAIRKFQRQQKKFRVVGGVVMLLMALALYAGAPAALQRALPDFTGNLQDKISQSDSFQGQLAGSETEENKNLAKCEPGSAKLAECGTAPAIQGTQKWFNTADDRAVSLKSLKGKVVLVDFFAYSCINCQRDAPHIKDWYAAYKDKGFEVVGVHSPEFAFEKSASNLQSAIRKEGIRWPVVQDNNLSTWSAYRNAYWPAKYLIDSRGTVRAIKFGEGDYTGTESKIRELLKQADPGVDLPKATDDGANDSAATESKTPETYLGWSGSKNYVGSPQKLATSKAGDYDLAVQQRPNTYSLGGRWTVEPKYAKPADGSEAKLAFEARDVYHVLSGKGTVTVRIPGERTRTITVDGTPNLYTIFSSKDVAKHTATITYSGDLQAYTFSFG